MKTSLDYFQARYYGAAFGRFISPDPMNAGADLTNPQSWNGYAYVMNNPLNATDPTGLDTMTQPPPLPVLCPACYVTVNGGTSPDVPGYPGCVSYGTQGCILQPVTLGGSGPGGGGGNTGSVTFTATGLGKADVSNASTPAQQLPAQQPPNSATKQTFNQCMASHSNDFSIAGTLNHGFNAIFGTTSLAVQNNFFAQAIFGNPITTFLYGSATDNAGTALSMGPTFVQMGMGTVISYGRRTTTIMALNLAGKGGVPLALGAASGTKAAIGQVANVAGGFISLEATLAVNTVFTAAEAAYCWSQP